MVFVCTDYFDNKREGRSGYLRHENGKYPRIGLIANLSSLIIITDNTMTSERNHFSELFELSAKMTKIVWRHSRDLYVRLWKYVCGFYFSKLRPLFAWKSIIKSNSIQMIKIVLCKEILRPDVNLFRLLSLRRKIFRKNCINIAWSCYKFNERDRIYSVTVNSWLPRIRLTSLVQTQRYWKKKTSIVSLKS